MRLFNTALLIPVLSTMSLCAAIIDDFEDGDNQNEIGFFWSCFAGGCDGDVVITNVSSVGQSGHSNLMPSAGKGYDEGFTAELSWQFNKKSSDNCINRFVSMMTNFCAEYEKGARWTNATKIFFYAKATDTLTIRLQLTTLGYSGRGVFFKNITVTNEWNRYTLNFSELTKSEEQESEAEFNSAELYELNVDVLEDYAGTPVTGSLYIDDIEVDDAIVSKEDNWLIYEPGLFSTLSGTVLADFERGKTLGLERSDLSKFNTMWYVYNDVRISGTKNTKFTSGVRGGDGDSAGKICITDGNRDGYDSSQALKIGFKLGSPVRTNDTVIQPFAGIGCMLSNSDRYASGVDTFLSTSDASDGLGIYFDYKIESKNPKFKNFKIAFYDTDTLPDGISFSTRLPVNNGEWRSASIAFADISLPYWPEKIDSLSSAQRSLDLTRLDKIEFRFQNVKETEATVYLDNFRFFGDVIPPEINYLRIAPKKNNNEISILKKLYQNGLMLRPGSAFAGVNTDGIIEIVRIDGVVISRDKIQLSTVSSHLIKTDNLANGVYLLRVNVSYCNGKSCTVTDRFSVHK